MANKKISELPYIGVPKLSGNTLVPLVTYFSAATGDTVHTYISDLQTYLISGLTGNTDVFVTGGTYSAGTITITNNTGGTFNITGVTFSGGSSVVGNYLPLSGGTVTGNTVFTQNISVTGGTGINRVSGNTSTDLLRVTQTGTGNAFVVDDSTNPDSTPFVINSGGSVSIGSTNVFSVGTGGTETKLNVSAGSSGVATSGLGITSQFIVESSGGSSVGLLSPNANNSQIYFGTPSDAFGAYLRWDFTNKNLILSTANSTGKIIFKTGSDNEAARIDQSGNFGIGLTGATQKFEVSGNTRIYGTLSADTISATTAQTNNLIVQTPYVPTGSTDPTGSIGTISWSGNSLYVKNSSEWVKFTGLTSW